LTSGGPRRDAGVLSGRRPAVWESMIVEIEHVAGTDSGFDSPTIDSMVGAPLPEPGFSLDATVSAVLQHAAAPADNTFEKRALPLRRNDSNRSLMSRQLSEWSATTEPDLDDLSLEDNVPRRARRHVPVAANHRRARSEGVGGRNFPLKILVPPTSGARREVHIAVPLFYTVEQTIASALHECQRRLPAATAAALAGSQLVLRIVEDGEPQFDLPALAPGAHVATVGEDDLALCRADDTGPWQSAAPADAASPLPVIRPPLGQRPASFSTSPRATDLEPTIDVPEQEETGGGRKDQSCALM